MTFNSVDQADNEALPNHPLFLGESSLENLLGQLENKVKIAEQSARKAQAEKSALEQLLTQARSQTAAADQRVETITRQLREIEAKNQELSTVFEREYAALKRAFDQHQEKTQQEVIARRSELVQLFTRQESALSRSLSDSRLETQATLVKLTESQKKLVEFEKTANAEKAEITARAEKFDQEANYYWKAYEQQKDSFQIAWTKMQRRLNSSETGLAHALKESENLKGHLSSLESRLQQQETSFQEKLKIITHVLGQTRQALAQTTHEKNSALENKAQLQRTIELEKQNRAKLTEQEQGLKQTLLSRETEIKKLKDDQLRLREELTIIMRKLSSYETPVPIQFGNSTCLPGEEPRVSLTFERASVQAPKASSSEIEELLMKRVSELAALESEMKRLPQNHADRKKAVRARELLRAQIVHLRDLLPAKPATKTDITV